MANFKTILIAVVAALFVVVVLQNTETVNTRILFITVGMPRAVLLLLAVLIGFVLGMVAKARGGGAKKK